MELDKIGIDVSSGSACDSQRACPSHVLLAMGVDESLARCATRISFGCTNSETDVVVLVAALKQKMETLRSTLMLAWV